MTRQRDNRSDWAEYVTRKKRQPTQADNAIAIAWQAPPDRRTDEQWAMMYGSEPEKRRPVQHESAEMAKLWRLVKTRWWRPGWWRWEAATWDDREAHRRSREGVRPAWPDCGLFLPPIYSTGPGVVAMDPGGCAVLELKSPAHKPKRTIEPNWWLSDMGKHKSRYGLSREQQAVLRMLDAMDWSTMVAFGADEAISWFDHLAGPKPKSLPEEWRYWTEGEL